MLLVDEVDRADDGFEAFLLEVLSDFQVTIPELGTIRAEHVPHVVLTSNRTREIGDALRRRCLYLYIDHPTLEKEVRILRARVPGASERARPRDRPLPAGAAAPAPGPDARAWPRASTGPGRSFASTRIASTRRWCGPRWAACSRTATTSETWRRPSSRRLVGAARDGEVAAP